MTSVRTDEQLDHYRIDQLIARSGMASIYRATDLRNDRKVAIKIPHPEMESDPLLYDRFKREEEIGKNMEHPGVMKVFADPDRSQVYMVMEWVDGRLLREILNQAKKVAARARHQNHDSHSRRVAVHPRPRYRAPRPQAGKRDGR